MLAEIVPPVVCDDIEDALSSSPRVCLAFRPARRLYAVVRRRAALPACVYTRPVICAEGTLFLTGTGWACCLSSLASRGLPFMPVS